MRVIAGKARGMRLKVPKILTRPSTDRLREALFSILGERVGAAEVLDLFAGSGALGLEALSRGAKAATFVEVSGQAVKVIEENLARTGLSGGVVTKGDVFRHLSRARGQFDLIFADPPYASKAGEDLAARLLTEPSLAGVARPGGMVVVEVESGSEVPESPHWDLLDRRSYGRSSILFYGLGSED